ncbi:terminase large subunit domain-containing protein [Streptomyces finlayi]|nr:terminase family protein [Streptomyces finlayi]
MAEQLGTPLMPWQRQVADTALEVDPATGLLRHRLVLVTVPRQSGKTALLRALFAHRCLSVRDASCWLTAQTRNDARDVWMECAKRVDRSVIAPLATIRRTNGSESVSWRTGSEFRIFAPSEDGLHGKSTDLVGVDEVWAFSTEQGATLTQAIVPTQATKPAAQIWLVSTAGTARSGWLRSLVDQCREALRTGAPSPAAFFEWSIPEDTADLDDLDVYAAHHPALGHTISMSALEQARAAMGVSEFARAYGNYWTTSTTFAINPALWDRAQTIEKFAPRSPVSFAVEVAADRSGGVIVSAGRLASGVAAVEVVEHRGGVGWIAPRLLELVQRHRPVSVVIDPHGPARTVHAALSAQRRTNVPLLDFTAGDLVAAHAEALDGLADGTLRVRPDRAGRMNAALAAATTRTVREQEVLSRTHAGDGSSPAALIAAELALYGLAHPAPAAPAPHLVVAGT